MSMRRTLWRVKDWVRDIGRLAINHLTITIEQAHPRLAEARIARRNANAGKQLRTWHANGCPVPPPRAFKQDTMRTLGRDNQIRVLVETGTSSGEMVDSMLNAFDQIYTVELARPLHRLARRRFSHFPHVTCIPGDSGTEIAKLVPTLQQPALFWLDAHCSGGITALRAGKPVPVLEELTAILADKRHQHVVAIDDARLFGSDPAYPTLEEVRAHAQRMRRDISIECRNDIIFITPMDRQGGNASHYRVA